MKKKIFAFIIACFLPFLVSAKDYGSGSIGMNVEFNNVASSKFTVNSVTVNGYEWSSREDGYFVDTRKLTVLINVTPSGEAVPRISYCGGECGEAFNVDIKESGSDYIITVVITEPEQDFVAFDLVEDEGAGGNPGEPGQPASCTISYQMNGGSPIEPVDFACGNPAPPPSEEQIKNGELIFAGWYADEGLTQEYDFHTNENDSLTIYAKWEEPRFRVIYDFNGAKDKDGHGRVEIESVAFVPMIVSEHFIDSMGVVVPEGNKLVAIEVNGKRYNIDNDEGYELNKDTTYVYIWEKPIEPTNDKKEVALSSDSGFSVTFEGQEGEEYNLTVIDVLTLKSEQIKELGVSEEEYKEIKDKIIESTKDYGNLLNVFAIEVDYRGQQYTDSVNFKVKMTEEMKKYNKFRFIYIDDENNFKVGEVVDVKVEGDYLVGTLPHLSVYAVVGEYVEEKKDTTSDNPKTSDRLLKNIIMLVVSMIGLGASTIYLKRNKLD